MALSSANSINISRLIPQAVYYAAAAGRAFAGLADPDGEATPRLAGFPRADKTKSGMPVTLCVPSGNFGNLTAGLYAMKMGAPVTRFIAATNINKTVPDYLDSGDYLARVSQATISNAMDVGAPSNFERMSAHFSWEQMRKIILGVSVSDEDTRELIARMAQKAGYILDPHSAVGWKGAEKLSAENKLGEGVTGILCTAHPAKFIEVVEPLAGSLDIPASLARAMERTVSAKEIPAQVPVFIEALKSQEAVRD